MMPTPRKVNPNLRYNSFVKRIGYPTIKKSQALKEKKIMITTAKRGKNISAARVDLFTSTSSKGSLLFKYASSMPSRGVFPNATGIDSFHYKVRPNTRIPECLCLHIVQLVFLQECTFECLCLGWSLV